MISYRDGAPWLVCDGCFQPVEQLTWERVERGEFEKGRDRFVHASIVCRRPAKRMRAGEPAHNHPENTVGTGDCPACFKAQHALGG